MHVRFRQTKTRLQASLIQTRREGGRVRNEHVAMLGTVDAPVSVAGRLAFWQSLHERLARLGNRIGAAAQAKLLGDIHARIPMVTADEQRALQIENAKADAQTWDTLAAMHAETAEGHAGLIANAERAKATAAAERQSFRARGPRQGAGGPHRARRGRRRRPGQAVTFDEQFLLDGGFTKADISRMKQVSEVSDAFGVKPMLKVLWDARERAERNTLRALHRRIREADGER